MQGKKRLICEGVYGCGNVLIACFRCKNLVSDSDIYEERNLCMDCANKCHKCNNIYYNEDFNKSKEGYQICNMCGIDCVRCGVRYLRYYDRWEMEQMDPLDQFCSDDCCYYRDRWIMKYFTVALECNHLIPIALITSYYDRKKMITQ